MHLPHPITDAHSLLAPLSLTLGDSQTLMLVSSSHHLAPLSLTLGESFLTSFSVMVLFGGGWGHSRTELTLHTKATENDYFRQTGKSSLITLLLRT